MTISRFPDWDSFEIAPGAADYPVAFCADLGPASVLSAYRHGIVPFPAATEYLRDVNEFRYEDEVDAGLIGLVGDNDPYWTAWWCPDPRPLIGVGEVHLGRNARKRLRRGDMWTTADQAYQRVAEECRADREPRWLTDTLLESMLELHREGWAHSIEVWQDGDLIGGALAVAVGRTLSGDTMFSRHQDAARIAVADMAARFAEADGQAIDAQWDSPFLRSLGAELLPRKRYLDLLSIPAARTPLPTERLPARRLIERPPPPTSL
jgi:leucyl/phenylalanyl-tRNA--protein transferase